MNGISFKEKRKQFMQNSNAIAFLTGWAQRLVYARTLKN